MFNIVLAVFIFFIFALVIKLLRIKYTFGVALLLLAILVGIFLMLTVMDISSTFLLFTWLGDKISNRTALDPRLGYILAIPLAFIMVSTFRMQFSLNRSKRMTGQILFWTLVMIYLLGTYAVTKDYNFDPSSGKALANVFRDPDGNLVKTYAKKVDPMSGQPVAEMTLDRYLEFHQDERDPYFQQVSITPNMALFNRTGLPLYWYGKDVNDKFQLFNKAGHHPQTNEILQPVTPDIVPEILKQAETTSPSNTNTSGDPSFSNSLPGTATYQVGDSLRTFTAELEKKKKRGN